MKTIGLIGGMSWESSSEYYRMINELIQKQLGGYHSAECVMYSVDFDEIERMQRKNRWEEAAERLVKVAQSLESSGADFILLCTNTMHKAADEIQANIRVPLLHIADETARQIRAEGLHKVGLLGTRYTMEEGFYKDRLVEEFGLEVILPEAKDRQTVHRVIFDELVLGKINPYSKTQYKAIIEKMIDRGAQGIILGCTEIGLLIHAQDSSVPLFDTTRIHAEAAVEYALSA